MNEEDVLNEKKMLTMKRTKSLEMEMEEKV